MSTGYTFKATNGTYYDLNEVFSTAASSASVASANPFKTGASTNVLNQFELYSSAGSGHPLQTNLVGYKLGVVDISKYYTPKYYDITGEVNQTITIPPWANKMAFVIQSKGGSSGTNVTGSRTYYASGSAGHGMSGIYYDIRGYGLTSRLPAGITFDRTRFLGTNFSRRSFGKYYRTTSSYTGGSGLGGTCYVGTYTINTSNRATAVTYVSNTGTTSYLQFNEPTNSNKVTVPNGTNGGNATTSANGTNATGASASVTLLGTPSYISGTSYSGTSTNSGFNLNPSITTSYPIPTGVSFTNNGGPAGQEAHIIYWFLL
jgi:hypothetical protein